MTKESNKFPLLIKYKATGAKCVVNKPEDIKSGAAFTVLETNYSVEKK